MLKVPKFLASACTALVALTLLWLVGAIVLVGVATAKIK